MNMNCNIDLLVKDLEEEDLSPKVMTMIKRAKGGIYLTKSREFLIAHLRAAKLSKILKQCEKGKYDK